MTIIDTIRTKLDTIEKKNFYQYIGIFIGLCILLSGFILFRFYRQVNYYKKRIATINEAREEDVRELLEDAFQVQEQRAEVDRILLQDEDFKIGGYFTNLLEKLQLTEKKVSESTSTTDREDNYRESELNAKFEKMNMKELTELLQELEQNKRISTKRLEITKSTKVPNTIQVGITIATLLPKTEITE